MPIALALANHPLPTPQNAGRRHQCPANPHSSFNRIGSDDEVVPNRMYSTVQLNMCVIHMYGMYRRYVYLYVITMHRPRDRSAEPFSPFQYSTGRYPLSHPISILSYRKEEVPFPRWISENRKGGKKRPPRISPIGCPRFSPICDD